MSWHTVVDDDGAIQIRASIRTAASMKTLIDKLEEYRERLALEEIKKEKVDE